MKRCPECEFLYYDEQERCDMDGTVLRFTSSLTPLTPPTPIEKTKLKSIWGGLTIPLLALVVISSVLVILYRAAPPKFRSSSGLKQPPIAGTNQETKLPESDSPQVVTAPALPPKPDETSSVPATRTQTTAAKSSRPVQSASEKPITVAPAIHVQMKPASPVVNVPKPATSETSLAPPASQKAAASSYKISAHPEPPPVKTAPQSETQNQDKDSKFKSLLKKAGRILKKPF